VALTNSQNDGTKANDIILRSVSKVTVAKFDEVFKKARALFID